MPSFAQRERRRASGSATFTLFVSEPALQSPSQSNCVGVGSRLAPADAWTEQESFVGKGCCQTEVQEEMDEELIDAARAGNVQKLRELIGKGADIEAKDRVRVEVAESCLQVPPN